MNRASKRDGGIVKRTSGAIKRTSGAVIQSAIVKKPGVGVKAAMRQKLANITTKFRDFPALLQVATSPALLKDLNAPKLGGGNN